MRDIDNFGSFWDRGQEGNIFTLYPFITSNLKTHEYITYSKN